MERIEREAAALAALGSSARLEVFRLLARHAPHPVPAGKIAEALGRRPNTLSVQVAALVRAGLVEGRRNGKQILYSVQPARVRELIGFLGDDCCNGRPDLCGSTASTSVPLPEPEIAPCMLPPDQRPSPEDSPPLAAFLCRANAGLSILAEAVVNARAGGRLRAVSAGSHPASRILPETADILRDMGVDPSGYGPSDLRAALDTEGARPCFVFTLCDSAADEDIEVPVGRVYRSHWPLPDPAFARDAAERRRILEAVAEELTARVDRLLEVDLTRMAPPDIQRALDLIGMQRQEPALAAQY